jgi:uncharacterized protein
VLTRVTDAVYLDSSALVKLAVDETESADLFTALASWSEVYSCDLARVEVVRAVQPQGSMAVARARHILAGVNLIPLVEALLDRAATLWPEILRSLDAIHLAAALEAGVSDLVTYDRRMEVAAESLGLNVLAPGIRQD